METQISSCRSCEARPLHDVIDLGRMPLSDGFLLQEHLSDPEPRYPLKAVFCANCGLMQITETVPPHVLFDQNYPYYSSFSEELLRHSRNNALELIRDRRLTGASYVIELASNDGYLLRNYVENGIAVLGIDPAKGPATAAQKIGVPTLNDFFTIDLAERLRSQGVSADIIHANNVLAHVADTNGFVEGIRTLLKDNGWAVIEVPYVKDLIENCEFDTIYHEHLCYFSVTSLDRLLRRHSLFLNHIRHLPIHGGSLRIYAGKHDIPDESVASFLSQERREGLDTIEYFRDFSRRVRGIKEELAGLLKDLRAQGKRIAGYGAAAKGTILINYAGIDADVMEFVVDRNIHKQGRFMPGTRQPILAPEEILKQMPDYVLILPWNFADEILQQQDAYRRNGGRFIIPIPRPAVL